MRRAARYDLQVPEVLKEALVCPGCGLSYEDFRKFGRFGCAQCYGAFKVHLKTLLKKIHGSNVHLGKKLPDSGQPAGAVEAAEPPLQGVPAVPQAPGVETIETLRVKMHQAIEQEDFELAAELRDKIRDIEQKG